MKRTNQIPPRKKRWIRRDGQEGMLTFAELAIASVIVSLLMLVAVSTMKITERGTLEQKRRQQALSMAKERAESVKNSIYTGDWNNVKVDQRFPPVTPADTPYNNYPPVTLRAENSRFIIDTEVRYVKADSGTTLVYVPTPETDATPETGDLLRIRTDVFYGKPAEWVPLPTLEARGESPRQRGIYSNLVNRRRADPTGTDIISGAVSVYTAMGMPISRAVSVEVAAYEGSNKIASSVTDSNGIFQLTDLPPGIFILSVTSAPGYSIPLLANQPLNFSNPVTIPAQAAGSKFLKVNPLVVTGIVGSVFYSTPAITPSVTPMPVPTFVLPAAGVVVSADDGNSDPVTTWASGGFAIFNVRRTPEPDPAATYTVRAFDGANYGTGYFNPAAPAPVTLFICQPVTTNMSVTLSVLDEKGMLLNASYYPITIDIQDDTATDKKYTLQNINTPSIPAGISYGSGGFKASVSMKDAPPPDFQNFKDYVGVDPTVTPVLPVTFVSYAVGTAAGKLYGLGNFAYDSGFQVVASDVSGTFPSVDIPVTHTSGMTYGGFRWETLRIGEVGANVKSRQWTFSIKSNTGEFSSNQLTTWVVHGQAVTLPDPGLLVTPRFAHMSVVVRRSGVAYTMGAFIAAIAGAGVTLPGGLGSGYAVSNYFSTATDGSGVADLKVALVNPYPTPSIYTVHARIVDPVTAAPLTLSQGATLNSSHDAGHPLTLTYSFP